MNTFQAVHSDAEMLKQFKTAYETIFEILQERVTADDEMEKSTLKSTVKVKIEFELTLDDCIPETLNKLELILIQHGQALVIANDSTKSAIEENEECCLPFY